jgi:hypothetical protein
MRLFVTLDGSAGFALKGDDIVSGFSSDKRDGNGKPVQQIGDEADIAHADQRRGHARERDQLQRQCDNLGIGSSAKP